MTRVPVVGGPLHGQLQETYETEVGGVVVTCIPRPFSFDVLGEIFAPSMERRNHTVRRVIGLLPGRTDCQIFIVLDSGAAYPPLWPAASIQDAVTLAWARGWAPPDEGSEFWPDGPAPRSD